VDEILDVTLLVAHVLEQLDIPYLVGGSLASSLHGIPRATQDVDLVARMELRHVAPFIAALRGTFYLDEGAIQEAVRDRMSFNLIHLGTLFKVDIFVAGDDAASRSQMERRRTFEVGDEPRRDLVLASPEDVIAHKLYWFSLGDEVSERQWSDAVGVLRVNAGRLDVAYLQRIAGLRGVAELLLRACAEVGVQLPDRER
jgi:hypothetical protein